MADVFISYSVKDNEIAEFLYNHLTEEQISVFKAPLSVNPGERWDETILMNLKNSPWVLFLSSKAACASQNVQQEVGIALGTEKKTCTCCLGHGPSRVTWMDKKCASIRFKKRIAFRCTRTSFKNCREDQS